MSPTKTKSRAVRSSNVTQASLDTLVHVSRDLRNQGCYLQSAKCLEAVCSSNVQALPADKAIACLDYAELLLDHFDNLDLAKAMLFKAVRWSSTRIFSNLPEIHVSVFASRRRENFDQPELITRYNAKYTTIFSDVIEHQITYIKP